MRFNLLVGLLVLKFTFTFAQTEIKGVIIDSEDNSPILGASIIEINTSNGVISDYSGRFKITVNDTSKIVIAYIGYDEYLIT